AAPPTDAPGRPPWAAKPQPVAQTLDPPRTAAFEVPGATGHTGDLVPLGRPASRLYLTTTRWARSPREPAPPTPWPQKAGRRVLRNPPSLHADHPPIAIMARKEVDPAEHVAPAATVGAGGKL